MSIKLKSLSLSSLTTFILSVSSILLLGCNPEKPLILATYTYSTNDRIENMRPLSEALKVDLNRQVLLKSFPDVASFIAGIKSNEVDIALINTLGYLQLALDNQHMIAVANLKIRENALDNYKTVLLTNQDTLDVQNLNEYASQLSMMFVAEGSTSGNLVPRLFLSSIGISEPQSQFLNASYGGNHTSTFEKLLNGETDLCAIGSNEYFKQIDQDSTLAEKVKLLWTSEEIPLGPLLLNKQLSQSEQERITNLLMGLHESNSKTLESLKAGWSEAKQADQFQLITDSYYDSFREVNGNRTDLYKILDSFGK